MPYELDRRGVLAAAGAMTAAGLLTGSRGHAATPGRPRVRTHSGEVEGLWEDRVAAFRGIPYGADTSGANRFQPPRPVRPWSGVFDAARYGQTAPQGGRMASAAPGPGEPPIGEDCLVLNVWTPAPDRGRRPVMVWLHGGGFNFGSGSEAVSEGGPLAAHGDVVVVSLNHRIGVLGFATFANVVGGPYAQSYNAGMLDIVEALRWVRANVAGFGGDPDNVTIFGASGGSQKVAELLAMPSAKGLFHRAIMQSGALITNASVAHADELAAALLAELNLAPGDHSALATLPYQAIHEAGQRVEQRAGPYDAGFTAGFAPVTDGRSIPVHPFEPVAAPTGAEIPLLIGFAGTEYTAWTGDDRAQYALLPSGLQARTSVLLGSEAEAAWTIARYRELLPEASPSELWFQIKNGFGMYTLVARMADRKAQQPAPVYGYVFDWRLPNDDPARTPHYLDVSFVFRNATTTDRARTGGGPEVAALQDRVSDAWVAFARSGSPQTAALPQWPRYRAGERQMMFLDARPQADTYLPEDLRLRLHERRFATFASR